MTENNLTVKCPALDAGIAQLVEHDLAKVGVASSNLVFRSLDLEGFLNLQGLLNLPITVLYPGGGIGRHAGLKIQWAVMSVRVQVPPGVQSSDHWSEDFLLQKGNR
mgnify:CR=1 FL=1